MACGTTDVALAVSLALHVIELAILVALAVRVVRRANEAHRERQWALNQLHALQDALK